MKKRMYTPRELLPVFLVLLTLALYSLLLPNYIHAGNYLSILNQCAISATVSVGVVFVMVVGEVDLSIGAQFALYGMLCAYLMGAGLPALPAVLVTFAASLAVGCAIGYFVSRIQAKALLATLAASMVLRGVTQMVGRGRPIFNLSESLTGFISRRVFHIHVPIYLMAAVAVLGALFLHQTYWGKYLYVVGTDSGAARKSGIPVRGCKMLAFTACSLITAAGAVIYLGRIGSASQSAGNGMELDALTAAALGGVGFDGGRGKVLPVVVGAIFLGLLSSVFISLNVASYYQNVIKGAILFGAIMITFTDSD